MQAVLVREGGALSFESYRDPEPGTGEVLVELRAAAVNRRDLLVRKPPGPAYEFELPLVPGSDGAGVRRDTGEEVVIYPALGPWGDDERAAGPGWRILGGPDDGTYAELVAVPEENLFPKPARFSWEEAAAFPLAGMTAYRALFSVGGLDAGQTVLVLGAGSGVSSFAVQLAAQAGARVLVTSSSAEKIERARELGAEAGVLYTEGDWAEEIRGLTGGAGVDLVLDSVGTTWADSVRSARKGGRIVVFGGTGGPKVELDVRAVYLNWLSILGTTMGSRRDFEGLLRMLDEGSLRPAIDSVRPLAEAEAAHDRIQGGEHFGKLVLAVR
ncbi:MAG: zinc-binding alcohol dehydrogenase/oxidoreductase [Gaiellaceae bacterium]|jgi:NADPH:quinone reductase-like Zn-dependent oxidoreductase|nr:zinc-binding alcohol dehydrogenase/oxidoreductase [Gaiellaceae bacterium]